MWGLLLALSATSGAAPQEAGAPPIRFHDVVHVRSAPVALGELADLRAVPVRASWEVLDEASRRSSDDRQMDLSDDAEAGLWQALTREGDEAARRALFEHYRPLSKSIAARIFRSTHVGNTGFAELCQMASVGLLEAIDHFKPELGVPFRYYCGRRIGGSIMDGLAQASEVAQQIQFRQRVARERLRSIKPKTSVATSVEDALILLGEIASGLAIGLMLEGSGMYLGQEVDPARDAYETLAWKDVVARLNAELSTLPDRDRSILTLHYQDGLAFEAIAQLYGLTKGRVSQVHKAAVDLLRKRLLASQHFRFEG
jgi:RNA polymerase sigma factor for flagellar operon FliA